MCPVAHGDIDLYSLTDLTVDIIREYEMIAFKYKIILSVLNEWTLVYVCLFCYIKGIVHSNLKINLLNLTLSQTY